ncbi:MAG TPA: hypothetical protein VJ603_05060 [Paucimonas sp.]|nr:hypothetical protein [Paucimonas sp.]
MQNAFAWERYQALADKTFEILVKRDKSDPRYSLKGNNSERKIKNEKMIPFDKLKLGSDELGNEIFASGKVPPNSECYFTSIMMTICWVPVGTEIIKRGYAFEAFKSQTGVVMCSDSVAGSGPCMDLQRMPTSRK